MSLLLIASCSVGVKVKYGEGENEPPANLYIFNLDPPADNLFVYEQLHKPESWEKFTETLLSGSSYELKPVAVISGQHYKAVSIRPRSITMRMAAAPVSSVGQNNFNPDHPGPDGYLEYLGILADSGGTYYALAYSRSGSEMASNFVTGALLEGIGLGLLHGEKWQGLGDIHVEAISAEKGEELKARLRPQS